MRTFLPDTDMYWSVRTLDIKRLVKRIVEAYQIYSGRVPNPNHPACLMWNFVFHHTHRVNLIRKNRSHYLTFFLDMPPFGDEPEGCYWPVAKRGGKVWANSQRWLEWGRKHELI